MFVAGPQVGYSYPELLLELDLHGGGIDARGVSFPGLSFYVLIGRGKDYAWSPTSANSDIVDDYVETLCGGDDMHYLYKGECRAMTTFDAGTLIGTASEPDRQIVFRETVHGPVLGYARAEDGARVAISRKRSTRGRELLSALAFQDLNTNRVHDPASFFRAMNQLEFTFNWFYADNRDIAMFSSGRLPVRAPNVGSGLPTKGTGEYEWRGFLPLTGHVRGINPSSGVILNWNNKPGRGFSSSDDNWSFGPVQRVQLLRNAVARQKVHTLASLTGAMNRAATQDLRAVAILPVLESYLGGSAPNAFDNRLLRRHVRLAEERREPARRESGREDRRPWCGDHGRRLAQARGCRDAADPGPTHRPVEVADGGRRFRQSQGLVLLRRLVRVRRPRPHRGDPDVLRRR